MKFRTDLTHLTSSGKTTLLGINLSRKNFAILTYLHGHRSSKSKGIFVDIKSENINKKHKYLWKGALGIEFEDYAKCINSIREIETFGQLSPEKQKTKQIFHKK